ncbi:MAG: hypothetical protein JWO37_3664 [Acidimicrobiales bacterium]|jgi:NAD(P)-dependent dehydrogenase (short-subunit alcohol dehydrogenase family)|nr:hypothetical protein [Acidimicrobiales bacterium]
MRELRDRVAVVTGAASGIGRGMAEAFAAEGMKLVLADVDAGALATTSGELRSAGAQVADVPTDVRDQSAVDALAKAALAEYGAVHVVCNNAGVWTMGAEWETELADWEWVIAVNLFGVVHGVRSFVPVLLDQPEGGHVVNTASMGGLFAGPFIGPYSATKHAVVGLSKSLRAELAARGANVGVSVVCPGEIDTPLVHKVNARPDRDTAAPEMRPDVQGMLGAMRDGLARGMSPRDAGQIVLEAVREGRFWVLPNGAHHMDLLRNEMQELFAAI